MSKYKTSIGIIDTGKEIGLCQCGHHKEKHRLTFDKDHDVYAWCLFPNCKCNKYKQK